MKLFSIIFGVLGFFYSYKVPQGKLGDLRNTSN